jgi:hypothetical protein
MYVYGFFDIGRVCKTNEVQFLRADLVKSKRVNETSLGFDQVSSRLLWMFTVQATSRS